MAQAKSKGWNIQPVDPPVLNTEQWATASLLGLVLIIMAVLQLIGFSDFKDILSNEGLPGPAAWAILIIIAELWGTANFFRLRLSRGFRAVSAFLAVAVSGFWFVHVLQLVSGGASSTMTSTGLFGKY